MMILWSGGCDSTLILFRALRDAAAKRAAGEEPEEVRTLSIIHPVFPATSQQSVARFNIKTELAKRGLTFEALEFNASSTCELLRYTGLIQQPFWLTIGHHALLLEEDLAVGWVRGDSVWQRWGQLSNLWSNLKAITDRTGRLLTPLHATTKRDILDELEEVGLLALCRWCEKTQDEPCGVCEPCLTHAAAEFLRARIKAASTTNP